MSAQYKDDRVVISVSLNPDEYARFLDFRKRMTGNGKIYLSDSAVFKVAIDLAVGYQRHDDMI